MKEIPLSVFGLNNLKVGMSVKWIVEFYKKDQNVYRLIEKEPEKHCFIISWGPKATDRVRYKFAIWNEMNFNVLLEEARAFTDEEYKEIFV